MAVLYVAYDVSRGLRDGSVSTADAHGRDLLRLETWLHIDIEHALNNGIGHVTALAVIASYMYATLHFIITPVVLIWLYRRYPHTYSQARTTLAVATIIGLVIFWLVPTTPPRLLPGSTFHDTMAGVAQWGWWGGDGSAPRGLGGLTNQLAAMPSLHVGWALWSGYWIYRNARHSYVRVLGALYAPATALVVMSTANHYLLDVIAGVADVALAAVVVATLRKLTGSRNAGTVGDEAGAGHPGDPADLSGLRGWSNVIDLRDVELAEQPNRDGGHGSEREGLRGTGVPAVAEGGNQLGRSERV